MLKPQMLCAVLSTNTWTTPPPGQEEDGMNCTTCPLSVTWRVPLASMPFMETCTAPIRLAVFIGWLKYRTMVEFCGTPVELLPGRCVETYGVLILCAAATVNWLSKFAAGFPDRSFTPLVTKTVTVLDGAKPYG